MIVIREVIKKKLGKSGQADRLVVVVVVVGVVTPSKPDRFYL